MYPTADEQAVLQHYPPDARPVTRGGWEDLGSAGGFSGARLWRFDAPRGRLCLRRWPPEHPSERRLIWMHRVLVHVADQGLSIVPLPLATLDGQHHVVHAGHLWEVTPWMAGTASYHAEPHPEKLRGALEMLARFHVAASSLPGDRPARGPSPGLAQRGRQMQQLLPGGGLERLQQAVTPHGWPELVPAARELLRYFAQTAPPIAAALHEAQRQPVDLLPCIRDVWHDHVLFTGRRVTGLVDFGALRIDSVAGDVARLLGSFVGDDADGWEAGLRAYQSVRRLTPVERQLVPLLDRSGVVLGGVQWLQWIYLEGRTFADRSAVLARLEGFLARIARLPPARVVP